MRGGERGEKGAREGEGGRGSLATHTHSLRKTETENRNQKSAHGAQVHPCRQRPRQDKESTACPACQLERRLPCLPLPGTNQTTESNKMKGGEGRKKEGEGREAIQLKTSFTSGRAPVRFRSQSAPAIHSAYTTRQFLLDAVRSLWFIETSMNLYLAKHTNFRCFCSNTINTQS